MICRFYVNGIKWFFPNFVNTVNKVNKVNKLTKKLNDSDVEKILLNSSMCCFVK